MAKTIEALTPAAFNKALGILKKRDPDLEAVLSAFGPPPFWKRPPGFPTLVRIILEQQVSLSSARAAFDRLVQSVPVLTPEEFQKLDGPVLRRFGFSRQKALYCSLLAESIQKGFLDLDRVRKMEDDQARRTLIKIKGIGRWTADIYLLMALRRPDIWPVGDLALAAAVQQVKRLEKKPAPEELEDLSLAWEPWRAVAARIFWHHYLGSKKSNPIGSKETGRTSDNS